MKKTLRIGENRGSARIWIEGAALSSSGWNKGAEYAAEFQPGRITYTRRDAGGRKVAGTDSRPIIDTNTDRIRESLGDCTHAEIEISPEVISIRPGVAPAGLGSKIAGLVTLALVTASAVASPYLSQFKRGAMRVLVACEESATVRDAFAARGHDAISCDLMETRNPYGWHVKGDVSPYLSHDWDLVLGFPPCTYNVISAAWAFADPDFNRFPGVGYHQRVKPGTLTGEARRQAREDSIAFIKSIWESAEKVAIENPRGFLGKLWREPSQVIEPHQFGHAESKATCLWLKGLAPLVPTNPLKIEESGKLTSGGWRWLNQTASGQNNLTPSEDRAKIRSTTYAGIAQAMADQWG